MNDPHDTLAPLLSAYLDDELDPVRRGAVAAHLATCPICAQELARLRAGDEALAGLRSTPPAPELGPRLRRRLRRQGARAILRGGLLAVIATLLLAAVRDLAILRRKDLPLWGRLGLASGSLLLIGPAIALCLEFVRDVRVLAEYAWLSDEPIDSGEPRP